jgi:hypothetical protein
MLTDWLITVVKITLLVALLVWLMITSEREEHTLSTREKQRR